MAACSQDRTFVYLEVLRGLAPLVAEHQAAMDRERRLPDVVFDALADAGLFRLWLPRSLGGPELDPFEFMEVVEAAAEIDGSVGWIIGNGAGMSRTGGYLPEPTSRQIFAEPRAFITSATSAVGTAVPVAGGFRVTGRWTFGSGAPQATWFMGLCHIAPDEASRICCYFPRQDVVVHDNWHASGLKGTASCDFEVRDAFVPTARQHGFFAHQPTAPGVVYRLPALSVYPWTVTTVPLGIAHACLKRLAALAQSKTRAGTTSPMRDRELVQHGIGRAHAIRRGARAALISAMQELIATLDVGGDRLLTARADYRAACALVAESATQIAETVASLAGSAAILDSIGLERALRDIQAATKHIAMSPNLYVVSGRLSVGLDPGTARF